MNKSADESGNSLRKWALMISVGVVGTIATVVYGVACMVKWAVITAIGKGNRV